MYRARIYYTTTEDNWNEGLLSEASGIEWQDEVLAKTKEGLKQELLEVMPIDWNDIRHEDINEYDHASEYWASWLVNENSYEASNQELKAWKQGKERLWLCDAHILVSKVTETKATL